MEQAVNSKFNILLTNPVFLSALFSWFSAQFIKTIIKLLTSQIVSLRELVELSFWKTGGMPSSHSALVISLCTSIAHRSGLNSDIFILSLCFALVVIRDAVGVRRSSGQQSKTLNEIGKKLEEKSILSFTPLKEIHGHKPFEVLVGSLLGFFIGTAFSIL
ncbi:MAG: divergent PAP2 family protein [Treponemataceae bacterium]